MKRNTILIILMLLITPIFCQEIIQYKPEFITMIPSGINNGQIAYDKYGLPHHTRSFGISNKNDLYISDPYNSRIAIFDLNFNFLRNLKIEDIERMRIYFADKIMLDHNDDLIIMNHAVGIYKTDINGKIKYFIKKDALSHSVLGLNHFYPFDDNIAFYNYEKQLCIIDINGIITTPSVNQYLNNTELTKSNTVLNNKIYNYIVEEGLLYSGNRVFPKDYYDFCSLRAAVKEEIQVLQKKVRAGINDVLPNPDIFLDQLLLGYDNDNNIYWQGYWEKLTTRAIAVFSKNLILLDLFAYKLDGDDDTYEALAPNGDIYIMQPKPEGVYFYKITRRW